MSSVPAPMWEPANQGTDEAERMGGASLTYWQDARRRLWRNRPAMASLVFILVLISLTWAVPFFSSHTYFEQNLKFANTPPVLSIFVAGPPERKTEIFLNTASYKLFRFDRDGLLEDEIRPARRDMVNRKTEFDVGGELVVLHARATPPFLADKDGKPLASAGWRWNRANWLGTDHLGRDLLVRLVHGARISLTIAAVATLVNFLIGTLYGGIAGYFGGMVDTLMMRFLEVIATLPLTLYIILLMVVLEAGLLPIVIAIGTVYWVDMARIVRGQILSLKQLDYVAAARTMGASDLRILTRHLIPNTLGPILVTLTMLIPSAIFIESFMSFIGLGVTPPMASWGTLISEAVTALRASPYQLLFPAAAISLTMFAFNFLGDGLRDALDPRLRA